MKIGYRLSQSQGWVGDGGCYGGELDWFGSWWGWYVEALIIVVTSEKRSLTVLCLIWKDLFCISFIHDIKTDVKLFKVYMV